MTTEVQFGIQNVQLTLIVQLFGSSQYPVDEHQLCSVAELGEYQAKATEDSLQMIPLHTVAPP